MSQSTEPFNPDSIEIHSNVGGAFHVGVEDRDDGPKVTAFISVNAQIRCFPINVTNGYPIHEIPLLRRLHARKGGSVVAMSNWAPGTPRLRRLTKAGYEQMWDSLVERYKVNDSLNHAFALYGGTNGQPRRLDAVLKKVVEAWSLLMKQCEQERRKLTDADVEAVIALCEPDEGRGTIMATIDSGVLDGIEIPATTTPSESETPGIVDAGKLGNFLVSKGVAEETAATYAAEAMNADAKGNLDDDAWKRVHAVGMHPGKRAKLMTHFQEYNSAL